MLLLLLGAVLSAQTAGKVTRIVPPADAAEGSSIQWNDVLRTGPGGRIRVQLNDGSILSLGVKSALRIVKHDERTQQTILELNYGMVRAQVVHLARPGSSFVIRTHSGEIESHGGDLIVDDSNPVETIVTVSSAKVTVTKEDHKEKTSVELTPGQWRIPLNAEPISKITPQ
jgi:ferric-dicitrate binding protein FerR (iron transport regulator)